MTVTVLLSADERAEDDLIRSFLPLARRLAGRFRGPGAEYEDLAQVASLALVKAARRFEPSRGEFGVYVSVTIVGELKRYLRDLSWSVRPPRVLQELGAQVATEADSICQAEGRPPSHARLAQATGRAVVEIREAAFARNSRRASSLDQPAFAGGRSLAETLPDAASAFDRLDDRMLLTQLCSGLAPEDRQLLTLRFFDGLTQREIGTVLGISQMRVSRRLVQLLGILREKADRPDSRHQPQRTLAS
ncbi:MAG: sigma-70 family RNA polymerase sigma factor [bacterium]|nr:sigma-70 family RNA polymerase sigma factor [bacterium]